MKTGRWIIAAMLAFAFALAHAAEWSVVAAAQGEAVYVDRSSIHQFGSLKKAWVLHSYASTQTLGDAFAHKSKVILYAFRCEAREAGYSQWSFQSGELGGGNTVWASNVSDISFLAENSDSVIARVVAEVC